MAKLKAAFQDPMSRGPSAELTSVLHAAFRGPIAASAVATGVARALLRARYYVENRFDDRHPGRVRDEQYA